MLLWNFCWCIQYVQIIIWIFKKNKLLWFLVYFQEQNGLLFFSGFICNQYFLTKLCQSGVKKKKKKKG